MKITKQYICQSCGSIHMKWNGKIYVGKMAGMEFTTLGPKQFTNKGRY